MRPHPDSAESSQGLVIMSVVGINREKEQKDQPCMIKHPYVQALKHTVSVLEFMTASHKICSSFLQITFWKNVEVKELP